MNSSIKKYLNSIQHQDILDFLKQLPDNTIDLVLTDPPYFLDKDKTLSKTEKQQLKSALNGWKTPQLNLVLNQLQ